MIDRRKFIFLIWCVLFICQLNIHCQNQFKRRNSFNLGFSVINAKFSPDYTVLAVIRQYSTAIDSYNPMTFQLIGSQQLENTMQPVALDIFGTDVIFATQSNMVYVYQRKVGSAQLIFKQKIQLKYNIGAISGLKIQKLNQDFNDKSQASSTRHVVVWHKKSFQVFKYIASQDTNKLTALFDKSYQTTAQALVDIEFFDQKFLVFGLQSTATVGQTNLIQLSSPSKITKVDSKLAFSMKSFAIKATVSLSSTNFLSIGHDNGVNQFKAKSKTIQQGSSPITNIIGARTFYDNNQMIGYYNSSSFCIYRGSQTFSTGYPSYTQKYQQTKKAQQPAISIIQMPPQNTGQLIINHCKQNNNQCFYYYSICDPDSYYTMSVGRQTCKKCNIASCQKCLNDQCVMCTNGFYVNSKKCQTCQTSIYGCTSCTQDGKGCHTCDSKEYNPEPVSNVCQCIKGNFYDTTAKKCVTCQTKILYCSACALQESNLYCSECVKDLNRIPSADSQSCICNPNFYFQNPTKQCQLCDVNKKCKKCTAANQCQQCDGDKQWTLNDQGSCICKQGYVEVNNQCLLCGILGCVKCQSDTKCMQCQDGFHLDNNGLCLCNQDRYLNSTTNNCDLCSDYLTDCKKCSNNAKCDTCDTTKYRNETPTVDGKCLCQEKYTQNVNLQCVLCSTPGCLHCQADNMCSSCNKNNGFNQTIIGGKCQCLATKYLDSNTCKDCSQSIFGCQMCNNGKSCDKCNQTANFDINPVNDSCNCLGNYFVSGSQCLKCQMICQHCQKCIYIVGQQDLLTTSVGCAQCEDDFEVQDSKCVQKSGNALVFILIGIGLLTILIIVGVCYIKKKRAAKQLQDQRKSKQSNASLVSMLLKQSNPDVLTSDRTEIGTKKSYQPLFSGNINYSISSEQRQSDKRSFNDSLKQLQRQRKLQFDRKSNSNKGNYGQLSKNININKKAPPSQDEILDKKKQGLFSHRGKG